MLYVSVHVLILNVSRICKYIQEVGMCQDEEGQYNHKTAEKVTDFWDKLVD